MKDTLSLKGAMVVPLNNHEKLLKKLAILRGISQAELSRQAELTEATLSRFFNSKTDIKISSFVSILECLGVDLDSLLKNEIAREMGIGNRSVGDSFEELMMSLPKKSRSNIVEHLNLVGRQSRLVKAKVACDELNKLVK